MTGDSLETNRAWEEFFKNVERRALQMARVATGCNEEALDIVQDSMLGLVKKYRNKPVEELTPLFYRILQSRIRDWYRRQAVRRRWQFWEKRSTPDEKSAQELIDRAPAPAANEPATLLIRDEAIAALEEALRQLPLRQQQTFLLRAWEGLSVAETAKVMQCSTGSIKTHYFRALHTLRDNLEEHWP